MTTGALDPADEGAAARAAFVRRWFTSLLETGAHLTDAELLGEAQELLAHLQRMEEGEARLAVMEARGRALIVGRSP